MRRIFVWAMAVLAMGVLAVGAGPWAIHLSWQNDPATTMTVMWRTTPDITTSIVEYGLTQELGQQATGARHGYKFVREDVVWHTVEITGLAANTTYHYRCGAPEYWSETYSFITAPPKDDPRAAFTFAIIGDTQDNFTIMGQVLEKVREAGVRFILGTGDLTQGGSHYEFNLWFKAAGDVFASIPFIPSVGNHDVMLPTYFDQFALPNNEKWFSYDYGPIHFTHLLSVTEDDVVQQRPWLIRDLRSTTQPWKIVLAHHPVYSMDDSHGPTQRVHDHWVDVLERFAVDIYFNGHAHTYERTWPIRDGRVDGTGVTYVTDGSAGANPRTILGRNWWTAVSEGKVYTYILVQVRPRPAQLTFTVYRLDGSVLDSFTMKKP